MPNAAREGATTAQPKVSVNPVLQRNLMFTAGTRMVSPSMPNKTVSQTAEGVATEPGPIIRTITGSTIEARAIAASTQAIFCCGEATLAHRDCVRLRHPPLDDQC